MANFVIKMEDGKVNTVLYKYQDTSRNWYDYDLSCNGHCDLNDPWVSLNINSSEDVNKSVRTSTFLSIEQAKILMERLEYAIDQACEQQESKCSDCGSDELQIFGENEVCGSCRSTESFE